MGFPLNVDLKAFISSELGKKLLLAPFYAYDGINEHGLAIAVAGVRQVKVRPRTNLKPLFVSYLVRKILDQCKTIREAVELAEKYIPFDLDIHSLNTHLLVVDASGQSVILEYGQDKWRKIISEKAWQVLTNKPIYNVPDAKLREKCWRFRSISETLEKSKGAIDWKAGLKILRDVVQKGTTWSVVYSLTDRELYVSIYQDWNRIYHLKPFAAGFQTKPKEVKL
jgi:predicted choloylglycine hydrolase